jgi:hypothetical protein
VVRIPGVIQLDKSRSAYRRPGLMLNIKLAKGSPAGIGIPLRCS